MMSRINGGVAKLLVIDDDLEMHSRVQDLVTSEPISVVIAKTLVQGVQIASQQSIDVILLDHSLPDGDGIDRIVELVAQDRFRPILYVTDRADSETVIESMKRGAFEYLSKPLDLGLAKQRILEAIEYRRLTQLPVVIDDSTSVEPQNESLVGRCRAMQEVFKSIGRLASVRSPILIEGEVGTGKEMIARAIHQHGSRCSGPFHKVSSCDFDDNAFQHQIFGKSGKLFNCHGGTLLIEEFHGWSMLTQSRLSKFLNDNKVEGDTVDTRIVVATSVPSRELVHTGKLRSDLYYALSPFIIRVPALRDRPDDLELLVSHFMQQLAHVSPAHPSGLPESVSPAAMQLLKSYDWPGNVAELRSVLQSVLMETHGAVLATGALTRSMERTGLPTFIQPLAPVMNPQVANQSRHGPADCVWDLAAFVHQQIGMDSNEIYEEAIAQLDQQLIRLVMEHTRGNRVMAAKLLGLTRTGLQRKLNTEPPSVAATNV
ncbi:MAG: sigma-54 dependent transcriptional regulator [Pirellula sp.]